MKTTVYLIRHGQSEGNFLDQFIGQTDVGLTETGFRQAELTAAYLKDIPAHRIYSSDLRRAYDTALATAKWKNMPVIKSQQMREVLGGQWEQMPFPVLEKTFPQDYDRWSNDFGNARCTGGESVLELQARIVGEVTRIAQENLGHTVMIFCHATPIRVFRAHCEGVSPDQMGNVPWATNSSVSRVEYENGRFRLLEYGINHFLGDQITQQPNEA